MSGEYSAFFYDGPGGAVHTLLHGYCRHRVQYADYPGITKEEGQSVRGIYATGFTQANMRKLDLFEGSEYVRVKTTVKLLIKDGDKMVEGEEKDVIVYKFIAPEDLERVEWDFEHFRNERMNRWTRGDFGEGQDPNDIAAVGDAS